MKINKKGFTLIELLAVIVILALIFLVSGVAVTNIIINSREKSAAASFKNIKDAAELYVKENDLSWTESGTRQEYTSIKITDLIDAGLIKEDAVKDLDFSSEEYKKNIDNYHNYNIKINRTKDEKISNGISFETDLSKDNSTLKTINKTYNDSEITVATFNAGFYNCGTSPAVTCPTLPIESNLIYNLFSNNHIDIIGMQEAKDEKESGKDGIYNTGFDKTENIADNLGFNYYIKYIDKTNTKGINMNAILSKYNIKKKEYIRMTYDNSENKEYCTNQVEPREILKVVVEINNTTISFYNTHFSAGAKCISSNFEQLVNILKNDPNPSIITGDFNANMEKSSRKKELNSNGIDIVAKDTIKESSIDFILVKSNGHIKVINNSAKTINTRGTLSDHNLVFVKLKIS